MNLISNFLDTLTENDEFCSCCMLCLIIRNIHRNVQQLPGSFVKLSQASALPLVRYITRSSSSFLPGRQEEPAEFLVVLIDHLVQCPSSTYSSMNTDNLSSPIHIIFGIIIKSSIKCTQCQNETIKQHYESVWSISIISCSTLEQALHTFCAVKQLSNDNMLFCSNSQTKVIELQSTQLSHASPVTFIQYKRFVHDNHAKVIRKLSQFVSRPEMLNMSPFITSELVSSSREVNKSNQYVYKLNAVVIHIGGILNSGHIFSYIRSPDNLWYQADDESVRKRDLNIILADNNSYILCYTKASGKNLVSHETECFQFSTMMAYRPRSSTPICHDRTNPKSSDYEKIVTLYSTLILLMLI